MRYQLQSLKKAWKGESLLSQWANCGSSQQEKREFYYTVFLLDPNVSKKEPHKQSLQKVTSLNKALERWMTKWEVAKLEGADPAQPDFEALADVAAQDLPERDHENQAWEKQGCEAVLLHQESSQGRALRSWKRSSTVKVWRIKPSSRWNLLWLFSPRGPTSCLAARQPGMALK